MDPTETQLDILTAAWAVAVKGMGVVVRDDSYPGGSPPGRKFVPGTNAEVALSTVAGYGALSEAGRSALRCPQCRGELSWSAMQLGCAGCDTVFPISPDGRPDLRLQRPERRAHTVEIGAPLGNGGITFLPLEREVRPGVDFSGTAMPYHLNPEFLSHLPRAESPGALALDLGCGQAVHRAVLERANFTWVGMDYANPAAQLLGDAHSLPFADESFDLVFSIAVYEHLQHPWVAARETYRVLKAGGRFIGTVAFCEPFHGDSYYHHSHLGTLNTLRDARFEVEVIAPSPNWLSLRAQAEMALFPKFPTSLARLIVAPVEGLSRLWWRLAAVVNPKASEQVRVRNTTGAFMFFARCPAG